MAAGRISTRSNTEFMNVLQFKKHGKKLTKHGMGRVSIYLFQSLTSALAPVSYLAEHSIYSRFAILSSKSALQERSMSIPLSIEENFGIVYYQILVSSTVMLVIRIIWIASKESRSWVVRKGVSVTGSE